MITNNKIYLSVLFTRLNKNKNYKMTEKNISISSLPIEIIKYHILIHLDNRDIIAFMMSCKYYYSIYSNEIKTIEKVIDREKRIKIYREECDKNFNEYIFNEFIFLDRIYILMMDKIMCPSIMFRLICKGSHQKKLSVHIHYTFNNWKHIENEKMDLLQTIKYNSRYESLWLKSFPVIHKTGPWYVDKFIKEFQCAISIKNNYGDQLIYDSNGGKYYKFDKVPIIYKPDQFVPSFDYPIYDWIDYRCKLLQEKMRHFV